MQTKQRAVLCWLLVLGAALIMTQTAFAGQDSPDWPNTCGSGKDITLFSGFRYYATIDPGDVDFVKIVIPQNANLRAYTESQSSFDPMGVLYNSSCVKVAEDWDSWNRISPNDFIITHPVFAGETYYLAISGQGGLAAQGNYNFRVYLDAPTVNNYTVTANAGTGGSISPAGSINVTEGSSMSFTVTPDACYEILDVAVNSGSVGAYSSFTLVNITTDTAVTASFYNSGNISINASSGAGGMVSFTGSAVPLNGSTTMPCGTGLSYIITPDTGYEILDVEIDGVSRGAVTS